ncbi:MAG: alkylation response protein AidB-like acyl-CoA dehydrogenase [Myxococcota bacterium]|jgi:alkylation response protein AidB-like acyl-CoA dehydrogenase
MEFYKPRTDDFRFLLEAFGYDEVNALEQFADYDAETVGVMADEATKLLVKEWLPLNAVGDATGLVFDPESGDVTCPEGFKGAYEAFCAAGLSGATQSPKYGGAGMPHMGAALMAEVTIATNPSLSMCPGLTQSLMNALANHGSPEQKQKYLPKLISGKWTGTMCLTEPQCGTDLGLLTTKAIPDGDGYKLTGNKIWISFGEHNLAENIIHLVLARLPDAPEGIGGISAFIVPKFMDDGSRNSVKCTALEHKMGIKASPTCVISMEDATGYLIGTPNKGMRTMFVMMNSARLEVGIQGMAQSEIAYQAALAYAKDRRQMRSLDPAKIDHDAKADVILVHPDVRRMLLNIKSTTEGMRALTTYVSKQYDLSHFSPDEAVAQKAGDLLALLTPIVKSYCTERGFDNISTAMQVCGGSGFTTDFPIEQFLRDERIALIYEGTNHIQALDLVGRKLPSKGGRLVRTFATEITETLRACKGDDRLTEFAEPLMKASKTLTEVTMQLATSAMADREVAGAVASNYLNLFALTSLALMWTIQAQAAIEGKSRFERSKLKTARYFMHNILPEMDSLVSLIAVGKDHMMAFEDDEF